MKKKVKFAIDEIVVIVKDSLYSVRYQSYNIDEYTTAFENWTDIEFLENFFEQNKNDLNFFGNISVEEAVMYTINEAEKFDDYLRRKAIKGKDSLSEALQTIFKPLYKREAELFPPPQLQKSKAYGQRRPSWLRLYAIRIEPNVFVVTGSAIKLVAEMHQRDYLKLELEKLEAVRQYLIDEQVIDNNSLTGILNI